MGKRILITVLLAGALVVLCPASPAGTVTADFERLSQAVAASPEDPLAGDRLRQLCRQKKMIERCVDFFEELSKRYPKANAVRFNAALAYVDNLPHHTLFLQAAYSAHSIEHASAILQREPDNWLALYIRGLNNLYWPLWYQRTDWAMADLTRCTQMSRAMPGARRRGYMALAFLALGDVYARLNRLPEAIATWKEGMSLFPSTQLRQRLSTAPAAVHDMVEQIRNRDIPIDTGLAVFQPEERKSPG
jgi:tetratricopeptide (TPR) repeat protein